MIRLIYFESRWPEHSREFFVRRWRMHGAFAMQFRQFWDPIRLYIQNATLADPGAFEGASPLFGGVGELFYADTDALQQSLSSPDLPAIITDGNALFSRAHGKSAATRLHPVIGDRPGAIRVFAYLTRPDAMAQDEFATRVSEALSQTLAGLDPAHAAVAANLEDGDEHAGILDFSFHTMERAVAGHAGWLARAREDAFLDRALHRAPLKFVTHCCIYYDTDNFGDEA